MVADTLAVLGGLVVVLGVSLFSTPAAVVVAGLLLILAAWRLS